MHVIVGLRNPGSDYAGTRHNVGAEVVEALAQRWGLRLRRGPLRVRADVAQATVAGGKVVLALPRAMMNVSGPPVASVLRYYKASPDRLLVVHDDIDLEFARLRLHRDRGTGGHRGVESVTAALGTRDFARLKVGVGRPPGSMDPADFVLRRFRPIEREEVDVLIQDAAEVAERFLEDPEEAVQQAAQRQPAG